MHKQKIRVDMPALKLAWEDESPDNLYYLDLRNGAVKMVHKHLFDLRDLTDEIEKNRERFLYVPKPERSEIRKDLRKFTEQVEAKELLPILDVAFESPHVLMAFRKILAKNTIELERLQKYKEALTEERIAEWLHANFYEHDPNFANPLDETGDEDEDNEDDDATGSGYKLDTSGASEDDNDEFDDDDFDDDGGEQDDFSAGNSSADKGKRRS